MTITEMLEQSGILTLLGMGIVFAFLTIMIICISLVGKIVHKLGLDSDINETGTGKLPSSAAASGTNINAVISAAVHEYQKEFGGQAAAANYIVTVNGRDYRAAFTSGGILSSSSELAAAAEPAAAPGSGTAEPEAGGTASAGGSSVVIPSPVAGTIIRHAAAEGSHVKTGDTVVIIESMKMELEIKATSPGIVHFMKALGTQVAAQDALAEIS